MQQVADPHLFDPTDHFGFPWSSRPPAPRKAQPAREHAAFPLISVKHIGQAGQEGLEQPAVRELVSLLLRRPAPGGIEAYLDSLLMQGLPAEQIYLRVLQLAARRLGELWLEDICTFVDVTLGTAALQSGMRHLAPRFHQHGRPARPMRSAILSTVGADQHTFGLSMMAEFFRRSGWTVTAIAGGGGDAIASRLRDQRNVVVGFSVSRDDQIPELVRMIRRLRQPGRPPVAGILLGGPLGLGRPGLARETGADAVGLDARQALAEAEALAAVADCE